MPSNHNEVPVNPLTLALAATLSLTTAKPALAASSLALGQGVSKKVLANGLTLLVKPVSSAPVVAVNTWVKVGSVQELEAEKGITHFIEHMLFKGTDKMKVGELDRLIKSAGGYNNAHTRYESTDFIDVMPSDKLDIAVQTMADALQNSTFDAAELDRERKVVLEELHRAQDNPGFEAWNKLTNLAFIKHPYMFPIIGYKPLLEKMGRADLVSFWKRWYKPQNLIVVIVGDVDAKQALAKAEKAFGKWPATTVKPAKLPKEPPQDGLRLVEFDGDVEGTTMVLGVPSCAELDPDSPALDIALSILGQGLSSRLNQVVREERKLVHSVASGQFNGAYPGLAYLWAELEPAQVQPAMVAIWEQVERMKTEPVSLDEIERQRVRIEHDEAGERMSMEGMAGRLGYYEALGNDYRLVDVTKERMLKVTAADIQLVMKKYFQVNKASLVVYRPSKSKPSGINVAAWTKSLLAAGTSAATPLGALKARGKTNEVILSNGARLLIKSIRHTPLVSLQISFPSGQRLEPTEKSGANNLLARTLLKGLPGQDAAAVARAMDDLGFGVGPYADSDRFGISAQMLATRFDASLGLLSRILREATLPADELEKERERVLKDIKDKTDSPDDYVQDLFNELFFGKHPYGRPLEGDASTVKKVRREDLLSLRSQAFAPERAVIVVVGDVDPVACAAAFEHALGAAQWPATGKPLKLADWPTPKAAKREVTKKLTKKQAHLVMGWPTLVPSNPDYFALRLVNSVMGEGMNSRLFEEVREKRGLCYTVQSYFDRRQLEGAWRIYVGTQPEKLDEARKVCLEVAAKVAAEGISADELKSAKAYAKGIFQVARQDFSTEARVLLNYEIWGLGVEAVDNLGKSIDAVTLEDCKRVAKKYLLIGKETVAIVRP